MDLDIEMGDGLEMVQEKYDQELPSAEDILQPDEPEEPGEVAEDEPQADADNDASKAIVPTKIHIRGLDTLHTDDIKAYVKAHYGSVDRVEWIDDTSANLSFVSEPAARDAIAALSSIEIADATALAAGETLPAKPLDGRPEISLHVRFAVETDRKQAGAALRSRYYLLHPEHDPEERRRRQQENRSRYRDRDRDRDHHHRRQASRRRDDSEERETFEASMYDDAPRPLRDARSPEPDDQPARSHTRENQGKELFADRPARRDRAARDRNWDRDRDRSASPRRDRDRDMDDRRSDDDADGAASSSRNNRVKARSIKDRLSSSTATATAAGNQSKELFPSQRSISRFGGGQLDELEKSIGSAHLKETDMPKIVAIPDAQSSSGGSGSLNIRGIATQRTGGNAGFSIKGTATAKELFPGRFGAGNAGKELMSKRRQRAEDLFS
ncbi:Uncharacterized protein ESCO_006366 [Escovopsis weberi]|uniref:Uncharacterized protein n=1 Tax=Escovopsis weberi TaxID=150374 RepID=A0A0M8N062_ESCWE|nr:Uncharacterized protein ESCO_006366 [Escovopsis weberi]